MGLNAKQKEAVEYLEGPLLVLAGPGTGKTQLLSEKVAYILKNTDTNPENILCLTFTETGAANMRERLKTIVGKDGLKVNIGTYHAFGSEILAQYKNYSLEYDRKLDAAIDEVTQFKIVKSLQDNLPGTDILKGDNIKDIISVIGEAKAAGLSAEELGAIAKQNIEDSKVLSEAISPLLENVVPRVFDESYNNAYKPIYDLLKSYSDGTSLVAFKTHSRPFGQAYSLESDTPKSPKIERIITILAKDLEQAIQSAELTHQMSLLTKWKNTHFEKTERGEYRLKDRVANKKLLSVASLMGSYEEYLKENGLYDFNDMIEEAVKVLRSDDGFRLTLEERYQFIMLDEFQDTNPSQFAIVKALTDYEKPMIMAVGDDDQAIYEFQGALASNLTDFKEYYGAHVVTLVENYRSTQEILNFSREIIRQAPDRFADKELVAHKESPDSSQILRYEFAASDAEYGFIAKEIAKLIKSGVKQSEIAVISYKRKYFEPLLPYLKMYPEIKIAYEKRDDLFEDEKIHEILTIARFVYELIYEKKSTVQMLELLSYGFFDLPILEVIKLAGKARSEHRAIFDVMIDSDDDRLRAVAEYFAELARIAFSEPLEIFLDKLISIMKIEKLDTYERFCFYENLASLRGKLIKHCGEKVLKLKDLVEMVDDYLAADMPLVTSSPYRDADEAIQVLSAHKAKGLEFEYVFIISADHTAWGKGKGNNNLLALPKNLTQIRHTGMTDSEKLRILYVALTRAKKSLIITNSLHDFNGKSPERLEYFEEYADGEDVVSPFLPTKKVRQMYEAVASDVSEDNVKNWLMPYIANNPDMIALYRERVKKFRMSASALTSFIDVAYAGPEKFFKSYILQVPRESETEALAHGDLVHKVFEKVTNAGFGDEEAVKYYLSELDKKELSTDIIRSLREKGPADLAVALKEFGSILRGGKAEVDFAPEKLVIDGVPVTGKIDHMIIDDEKKVIEIYDFKTGKYHKEKWQSHATLYKYMLQLGFYKLLLNNSPKYAKYKVEKAHILFVTPDDNDGEVYDKIYEYNDKDEKELKEILSTIYNMVESLNFISDNEIMISPDKNRGLKDIKEFIELLLAKKS